MSWTPLSQRIDNLPLIIAGPILRRVEPASVTVWIALKQPRTITLRIYSGNSDGTNITEKFKGTTSTVQLGDHLHVSAITAEATAWL